MRANSHTKVLVLVAAIAVAGCSTPNSNRYNTGDVGRVIETSGGTVVTSRIVEVRRRREFRCGGQLPEVSRAHRLVA